MKRVCVTALHLRTKSVPPPCWLATSTGRIGSPLPATWMLTQGARPQTPPVQLSALITPVTSAYLWRVTVEEEGPVGEFQASGSHARRMQFPRLHREHVVVFVQQLPPLLGFPPLPLLKGRSPKVFWNPRGVLTQSFTAPLKKTLPPNYISLLPSLVEHMLKSSQPACRPPQHSVSPHLKCPRRGYWRTCMEGSRVMALPQRAGALGQELKRAKQVICAPSNSTVVSQQQMIVPPCAQRQ